MADQSDKPSVEMEIKYDETQESASQAGEEALSTAAKAIEAKIGVAEKEEEEKPEEKPVETIEGKIKDKLEGKAKAKGKKAQKELIKDINDLSRNQPQSGVKYGVPAPHVPTTTAAGSAAASAASATTQVAQQAAQTTAAHQGTTSSLGHLLNSAAGHGAPPAGSTTARATTQSINSMQDLMKAGKAVAEDVWKGVKGSKSARLAGVAALASAAGWAAEKAKGHKEAALKEYNREQKIRKDLMSDG